MLSLTAEQATVLMHMLKLHNDKVSKHASEHLQQTLAICE